MSPVKDPALLPVSTSIMELVYRKSDRERERKKIIVLNCFKAKVEYVVEGEGCKGKGCVHVGMAGIYCPFAGMVASRSCCLRGRKGKVRQLREFEVWCVFSRKKKSFVWEREQGGRNLGS